MSLSYTAVWASETFGLGPQAVAIFFVVAGAAGAIGNPLIGLASDRLGRRRPFVVGQLAISSLALIGYTRAESYELGLFLVAFSGFGVMGLALTTVGDIVRARGDLGGGRGLRVLSTERTAWAMGIIIGPAVAATIVATTADVRPAFAGAAALQMIAGILAWRTADPPRRPRSADTHRGDAWPRRRTAALAMLVVGLIFVALPSQARNMYIPLFITQVLAQPASAVGPAFTLNAMIAVMAMPHMGTLANRIGAQRVLYLAIAVGLAYCLLQANARSYPATLAIQSLMGITIALWSTGGLIYLQQLMPERGGMAGGLYLTVQQVTPMVSGLVLGPIAGSFGVPSAFTATAVLLALAILLIVPAHRALAGRPARAGETASAA